MQSGVSVRLFVMTSVVSIFLCAFPSEMLAEEAIKEQVDDLSVQINKKQARVKEIDALVEKYQRKIKEQEGKQASLENELVILDNQIKKAELDIERTKIALESTELEIRALADRITQRGDRIARERVYAADLIRDLARSDSVSTLQVLLSQPSLSAFFDRLEERKRVQRDLYDAMQKVKDEKTVLEDTKRQRDDKKKQLEQQQKTLTKQQLSLELERNSKISLVDATKMKQSELDRVMYELQQQQQSTSQDISDLEIKLKDTLDNVDVALSRGDVLLNWPVDPSRGVTATFHDPSYPFRNLFAHPGTDVRASVGTPIRAAAGGYVAWNKQGRLYGNYIMIVHPGNIATVYAHLSKFVAKPDTYVQRGDIIGLTGGMPGQPGAGLSTGPHLHFEVRQNGIPVDPENYLPSVAFNGN